MAEMGYLAPDMTCREKIILISKPQVNDAFPRLTKFVTLSKS